MPQAPVKDNLQELVLPSHYVGYPGYPLNRPGSPECPFLLPLLTVSYLDTAMSVFPFTLTYMIFP